MNDELRKQIALFRFGLISALVGRKGLSRGEQEACLTRIIKQGWDIPGSARSSIARSTVLRRPALYQQGGERLESLEPKPRKDRGRGRALDPEIEEAVIRLRKENPAVSLPVFFKLARSRALFPVGGRTPSKDSLYRLF